MSSWPEPASFKEGYPKITKYCKTCRKDTLHEIRMGSGVIATMCIACLERALCYELDRD